MVLARPLRLDQMLDARDMDDDGAAAAAAAAAAAFFLAIAAAAGLWRSLLKEPTPLPGIDDEDEDEENDKEAERVRSGCCWCCCCCCPNRMSRCRCSLVAGGDRFGKTVFALLRWSPAAPAAAPACSDESSCDACGWRRMEGRRSGDDASQLSVLSK